MPKKKKKKKKKLKICGEIGGGGGVISIQKHVVSKVMFFITYTIKILQQHIKRERESLIGLCMC